jgi:2-polyprenyl-3-methyl-5-hydroxy-6-metoxy-1,4-benzoquinol methylase
VAIDRDELKRFVDHTLGEIGAAMTAALVVVGDKLGLFRSLAAAPGPSSPAELAERTGVAERYLTEWLAAQAAAGYVSYDPASGGYFLSAIQASAFADETSPVCMLGGFQLAVAAARAEPRLVEAFRSGRGISWQEHDAGVFEGTERFFRPAYATHLVRSWLPALEGVEDKLQRGARVADVGCGRGASTLIMARAYPEARFVGFDSHPASIAAARAQGERAGLADRCRFEVASAQDYPGQGYDLVTCFDCLHDMGDPVAAARHVRQSLAGDGTWMIVEPLAGDSVAENLNPVGRIYYAASTLVCTPASLAEESGLALGAQAGERRIREVVNAGGFRRFRRAAQTTFNMVLEARP